jgi:hypothetical protein
MAEVTVWTFVTDDSNGLVVGVFASEQAARDSLREWAGYLL